MQRVFCSQQQLQQRILAALLSLLLPFLHPTQPAKIDLLLGMPSNSTACEPLATLQDPIFPASSPVAHAVAQTHFSPPLIAGLVASTAKLAFFDACFFVPVSSSPLSPVAPIRRHKRYLCASSRSKSDAMEWGRFWESGTNEHVRHSVVIQSSIVRQFTVALSIEGEKKKRPTALDIPVWSPTTVLLQPALV